MKLEVLTTVWVADERVFGGGTHDDVKVTKALAPFVAAAEAAGVVRVLEASPAERRLLGGKHVQSQADGEKAYERAQREGRWQHGNLQQAILDREARLDDLDGDERVAVELELADLRERFAAAEVPE